MNNTNQMINIQERVLNAISSLKFPRCPKKTIFASSDGQVIGVISNSKSKHLYNLLEDIYAELEIINDSLIKQSHNRGGKNDFVSKKHEYEQVSVLFVKFLEFERIKIVDNFNPVILEDWSVILVAEPQFKISCLTRNLTLN